MSANCGLTTPQVFYIPLVTVLHCTTNLCVHPNVPRCPPLLPSDSTALPTSLASLWSSPPAKGHLGADCAVHMGDASVNCAECRRAGLDAGGYPAGFSQCPLLLDRVARLRARINYGSAVDNGRIFCVGSLHFNMDHARRAFTTFPEAIAVRDGRLAEVGDAYRPSRKIPALPHGHLVYAVADDPEALMVTHKLPFDVFPVHVSRNVVAIFCEAHSHHFVFISMHAPPHCSLHPILDETTGALKTARSPNVIVAGDVNVKHRLRGPIDSDACGLLLAHFVLCSHLVPLNDVRSLSTFETPYSASWLHVTFGTPPVLFDGFQGTVSDDTTFSEHRLLDVRVGEPPAPWKRLTTYVRHQLLEALRRERWFARVSGASIASSDALDRVLVAFYALYDRCYTRHLRAVRARPTSQRWFTSELTIERAAVTAKRRCFLRARDPQMRAVLQVFGRLRQLRFLPSLVALDGTKTSTHQEPAALLLRTQITMNYPSTDEAIHEVTRSLASAPYASLFQDVSFPFPEAVDVLRNTPTKSAPGPDNISPVIMKALFRYQPAFFLTHLRSDTFRAVGGPLKPICVSSAFGKTLERLLNGRSQYFVEVCGLVHPRQYGFTRGRSSAQRMPAVLMSLDFHGAFDSVWHPHVLRYFRERWLPSGLHDLLRTFLEHRSVFVRSHAGRIEAHPTLGSPQGSPLSPLLWNVVTDTYADDTIILVQAPSRDALGVLASDVRRCVTEWARPVKISLNFDKTFCVFFSHGVCGMERVDPTRSYVRRARKVLMYYQVMLAALPYESPVWWGEDHVDCPLYARLVTIQSVALLALTGAFCTTSIAALQILVHAPPIDFELERLNVQFRLFTLRRHDAFRSLRFRPHWVANPLKDVLHPSRSAAVPLVRLSAAEARATSRSILGVGCFRLLRATSAYAAEVLAFLEALQHVIAEIYSQPVALYTDCLSLLQALASARNSEPYVITIRNLLRRILRSVPVHIYQVPKHAGVFGNEAADFVAQRAARAGLDRSLPLSFRVARRQLQREFLLLWTVCWRVGALE
ncbi:hypothetical protein HPB52_023188 [Rhipicephalus sanguineus]|uniref:RNase H type-1 domain-containing protein n=1 Tax=Rhipicephalus sanguineus TaxID=34632 RepID=A0A9D4T6F9_RHISA|nr:hypothetical protein HPB52_023188 [Rhipicephalus sanguineus]